MPNYQEIFPMLTNANLEDNFFTVIEQVELMVLEGFDVELAYNFLGYLFMSFYNMDGRLLVAAAKYFKKAENWPMVRETHRIANLYGNFKALKQIKELIDFDMCYAVRSINPSWFIEKGLKWFDLNFYQENPAYFMRLEDVEMFNDFIEETFKTGTFWPIFFKELEKDKNYPKERKTILELISKHNPPVVWCKENLRRQDVDSKFRQYCEQKGIKILKCLQQGKEGIECCSCVYLVLDVDGIIKVFKEVLDYNDGPLGEVFGSEEQVYKKLPKNEFSRKCYGAFEISPEYKFLSLEHIYSRSLRDWIKIDLSEDDVNFIAYKLAKAIDFFHSHDLVIHDLKPENVFFDGKNIKIIDFGVSRFLSQYKRSVDVYLATPRYGTPECCKTLKAEKVSDIFQFGIILHELLTHQHPFALKQEVLGDREQEILNYFLPNCLRECNKEFIQEMAGSDFGIIQAMLNKDPKQRPNSRKLLERFTDWSNQAKVKVKKVYNKRKKTKNIVLFPARMGIPHKGHIDYMSRILDLGYYLIISLQRSFTITDRDPIPKSIVMKMVAQSLFDKGYTEEDFHFIFTPFYETEQEMKMHFAMMDDYSDVVAIASGNPDVINLFNQFDCIDQKAVFGSPEKDYYIRSWGSKLRKAVKRKSYSQFKNYAASGVEKVLSFKELKKIYGSNKVDFVPGVVRVSLVIHGDQIVNKKIIKYLSPEESVVRHLQQAGYEAKMINTYTRDSIISLDQKPTQLVYQGTRFNGKDLTICYKGI